MNVCPNKSHPDWIELVSRIGEKNAYREFLLNGFEIPNPGNFEPLKSFSEFLNGNQVKLDYVATYNQDGSIKHRADNPVEELPSGRTRFKPLPVVSEFRHRKTENVYRNMMERTAKKLLSVRQIDFDNLVTPSKPSDRPELLAKLRENHFSEIDIQIVNDYLNFTNDLFGNTDELFSGLMTVAQDPRSLESFYNTHSEISRNSKSPVEKLMIVGEGIFGPEQWDQMMNNFDKIMDQPTEHESFIDPTTGKPMTLFQLVADAYVKYLSEERRISEIKDRVLNELGDVRTDIPLDQLMSDWKEMSQRMGAARGAIRKENDLFFRKMGNAVGVAMERESSKIVNTTADQEDISSWSHNIQAITDFSERQLVMQYVGREVSVAALKADAEKLATATRMENLMRDLVKWHYAEKPKSWVDKFKFWTYSKQQQAVFDWILEKDQDGNYTGNLIARYDADEEEISRKTFEKRKDPNGRELPWFKIPNREILSKVLKHSDKLNEFERAKVLEIARKYNNYHNYFEQFVSMNEEEQKQAGQDTTWLRKTYVRASVRAVDAPIFIELKREAAQYANTARGKKAQAKIDLYDYFYEKNSILMSESGNEFYRADRAMMPYTYADFQEMVQRYGWKKAWEEFRRMEPNDQDDYAVEAGVVVSLAREQNFANAKRVPFRTLQKKKNFSVNVPKIFSHHLNTMIFKKHYDPVVAVMDAAHVHYKMKSQMGEEKFDSVIKFIEEYADQRIFFRKTDFDRTIYSKGIRAASSLVVTQFLGLAPVTSLINLSVGLTESYKHLMGDYGLSSGSDRFRKGMSRILMGKRGEIGWTNISDTAGRLIFNPKATAILNHYGIQTFSSSEIERVGNVLGAVQDAMLILQKNSEVLIRGASFFAEMSDEEWDAFTLNPDGTLNVGPNAPAALKVAEWKNKIGNIQGKYDDETKRLYHGNPVYQSFFLFKGWLIDYMRNRLSGQYTDQFGVEREGYIRTGFRLLRSHALSLETYKGTNRPFTELEKQNLRKIAFDIVMLASLALMQGALFDDDDEESFWHKYLGKINAQMFLLLHPTDIINLVKNPFAGIYNLEQAAKILEALFSLQFERAAHQGVYMIPGRQIYEPIMEAIEEDESE